MRNSILSHLLLLIKLILNVFFIRLDDYGTYFSRVPGKKSQGKRAGFPVTEDTIKSHLLGQDQPIGSYCISKDNTTCLVMLDYDSDKSLKLEYLKGNPGPMLEKKKELLEKKVLPVCEKLRQFGISYLLEDSVGGYHIWIFFSEPIPSKLAYDFAHSIDPECQEAFPKQSEIEPDKWGNYVRLPGKYHSIAIGAKEADWSKIWDEKQWVSTEEAKAWEIVVATPKNLPEIIERWLAEKKQQQPKIYSSGVKKQPMPAMPVLPKKSVSQQTSVEKVWYIPPEVVAQVKAFWNAARVFAHFGISGEEKAEGRNVRIKGHGGLTFQKDAPEKWYWFEKGVGGDQIDAWAYYRFGKVCNRLDKEMFKQIIVEMAEVAGIALAFPETPTVNENIENTAEIEKILKLAEEWGATYKWEENKRSRATDRCTFFSILELIKKAGKLEISLGCRILSDLTNYSKDTASKSLSRLLELGVITLVEESDGQQPARYSLSLEFIREYSAKPEIYGSDNTLSDRTQITPDSSRILCPTRQGISPSNLGIFKSHDFFTWGSKIDEIMKKDNDPDKVIGRTGLEFVSALELENDISIKEISRRTGMNQETARRKAKLLEKLGIVTLTKVGRTVNVHLVDSWRIKLQEIWKRLKTYGCWQRRKVKNASARLEYVMESLRKLPPGEERASLLRKVEQLRERRDREAAKLKKMMNDLWVWVWDNLTEDQRERWAIMTVDGQMSEKEALRYVKSMVK